MPTFAKKPLLRHKLLEFIHFDRLIIRNMIRKAQREIFGVLLDIGCGRQPYRNEFRNISRYVSLDRIHADIVHDLESFPYPLEDGVADWILCTQVIDDLPEHDAFIQELHRLLTKNGRLILSASFVWELHELPHDYGRPSSEYLRMLLERNGFEIVEMQLVGNSWITLGQVININLDNIMAKRWWWIRMMAPLKILNSLFFYVLGSALHNQATDLLPLGFFVVARKK